MENQLFTAAGCSRCNIAKQYMADHGIAYQEHDIKAEGKQAFSQFYREHRRDIFRGEDGVEFPVFYNEDVIRQGIGPIIGYLMAGNALGGFVSTGVLHGPWLDGIDISGGDPEHGEALIRLLTYLKGKGLKLQVTTDGRNGEIMETVVEKGLCDRAVMAVRGPRELYEPLSGRPVAAESLEKSIRSVSQCPEYLFFTEIRAFRSDDGIRYVTPEEISETAQMIEKATGSKKHPYEIRQGEDPHTGDIDPLPGPAFFKYRTAARRYMVMAEIKK